MRTMSPGEPYAGMFEVMLCAKSRPALTQARSTEMLRADLRLMSLGGTRRNSILVGGAAPALATLRLIWPPSNTRSRGNNQLNLVAVSRRMASRETRSASDYSSALGWLQNP